MIALFKRAPRAAPVDTSALGVEMVAMLVADGAALRSHGASGCVAVLVDSAGRARRLDGAAAAPGSGETAWLFRPGPYQAALRPFAAAVEVGLRLTVVIDADPRAAQQRFDLYLASEVQGRAQILPVEALFAAIEAAVQRELEQGHLDLPPCTSLAEWNAFRAGLNRLLYLRFGLTVEECLPVDLGDSCDFAAVLAARAAGELPVAAHAELVPMARQAKAGVAAIAPADDGATDAAALRRLFLELPCLMCALRVAVLPRGAELFQRHQDLLRRLDLVSLQVTTMPALQLAAPGLALARDEQARRVAHARRACATLDDAWALLARLQRDDEAAGADLAALFDDAARIVANLEADVEGRRATAAAAS